MLEQQLYAEAKLRDSQTPTFERRARQRREAQLLIEHVRQTRLASIFRPAGERQIEPTVELMWT